MERKDSWNRLRDLFGKNFVGPDELCGLKQALEIPDVIPEIPFSENLLRDFAGTHVLILSVPRTSQGELVTLLNLRNRFGIDPLVSEPCFYNQDWYLKEAFAAKPIEFGWNLLQKDLIDRTRGLIPEDFSDSKKLPSAVLLSYAFFVYFQASNGEMLWPNSYVWCNDLDRFGDRIYVGRYIDPTGSSKNGFEIHRHLKIKSTLGAIDWH